VKNMIASQFVGVLYHAHIVLTDKQLMGAKSAQILKFGAKITKLSVQLKLSNTNLGQ